MEVFGSAGAASSGNWHANAVTISDASSVRRDLPLHFFIERYYESYVDEISQFVAAIAQGQPVPVVGNDGRVPVLMAMAGMRSLAEGRPVKLAEVEP